MASSLNHQVPGVLNAPRAGTYQDISAVSPGTGNHSSQSRLWKVMCSQLAEVPLMSKLLPVRSVLCFSQVRRCDPGAPSSLRSLSWRCKGLKGEGLSPLPNAPATDVLSWEGQVNAREGDSKCLVSGGTCYGDLSESWDLICAKECTESSWPPEPKVKKEAASCVELKLSRGMAQPPLQGQVGIGFLPKAAGAAVWLLPFTPHLLIASCPEPPRGARGGDARSDGSSHFQQQSELGSLVLMASLGGGRL